jgi:lipoprotein-anchoring transpeptidase ErfK/SrfK
MSALRTRLAALLIGTGALVALGAASASAAGRIVTPTQEVVTLHHAQHAHTKPAATSAGAGAVSATTAITDATTVLPVLGAYKQWLFVRLPGRPNGHTGWIQRAGTTISSTSWHIVVDTAKRDVTVYRSGHPVKTFKAVVGKPSTPTPPGEYFVEESLALPANAVGAPYALALSARSNVLQEFDGGPGQIALHGLDNVGGVPGTAASHGCVRLDDSTMRWLVKRIAAGVPVTIV